MKTLKLATILFAICVFFSCSKKEDENPIDQALAIEWYYGRNDYNMIIDDAERNFIVHIPQSYDSTTAHPVVFMLHGASGDGEKFYNISRWKEKGEEEGIITVYPTAIKYSLKDKNVKTTRWSTPSLPTILEDSTDVIKDDVVFFKELLDILHANFNIDEERAYCVGFSNGGGMIRTRLYPEMPDRFAAFGTSGGLNIGEVRDIPSGIQNSLYMLVGSKDQNLVEGSGVLEEVPFSGSEFMNHEFYGELFKVVIDQCALEHTFTEEPDQPKMNLIKFEDAKTSWNNKLYLGIINDLQHNYANETNNPHAVVATNLYWEWFENN